VLQPGDLAVLLPQFDIVAVDELLCSLNGGSIVRAVQIDCFLEAIVTANQIGSVMGHVRPYSGGCNPGELTHWSIWAAVSAMRALLSRASCSGPGRSSAAFAFRCSEKRLSRSLRERACLKRRRTCMAHAPFHWSKAGAQPAFSSQIKATDRAATRPSVHEVPTGEQSSCEHKRR
jgi:hypothetical protein